MVHFLDNESARYALLKGFGETVSAQAMISAITRLELERQTKSWYSRVPSFSNLADDPSRNDFEWLISKGSRNCHPIGERAGSSTYSQLKKCVQ